LRGKSTNILTLMSNKNANCIAKKKRSYIQQKIIGIYLIEI